jgi:hypothetical protein
MGPNLRPEAYQEGLGGHPSSPPAAQHHELPQEAHPPQQTTATKPSWAWGHNCPLTAEEAKRAALELVQKKGAGKRDVPQDLFDFMRKADVIYLDENNNPVTFKRVIIAWED